MSTCNGIPDALTAGTLLTLEELPSQGKPHPRDSEQFTVERASQMQTKPSGVQPQQLLPQRLTLLATLPALTSPGPSTSTIAHRLPKLFRVDRPLLLTHGFLRRLQ